MVDHPCPHLHLSAGAWALLFCNLVLLAGQVGLGKQAALDQAGIGLHLFFQNPFYLASMACLMLQTVVWPLVLQRVPLGFAYGVNSLNYVSMLAIGRWAFGETVTVPNLIGAALIMGGVWVWSTGLRRAP